MKSQVFPNRNRAWSLVACTVFSVLAPIGAAPMLADLDATQRAALDRGDQVVVSRDMPGGVWPELTVYQHVNAPVAAVRDVFLDYDNAHKYIPNLVSARVFNEPEPGVRDIEYTQRLPLLGHSSYTVRNWYENSPTSMTVRWELLESGMAEISDGSLRVEQDGNGCILRYTNYVKPKSSIAIVAR